VSVSASLPAVAASDEDRAVERSLGAARERARERYERIVDAADELIGETQDTVFTLQEVASRAGISLRTFYQFFDGRDDLMLAVFARSITTSLPLLNAAVRRLRSPVRQLQAYIETSFRLVVDEERPQSLPLIHYHLRLTQADPDALGRILAPRNAILLVILERGVQSGVFRHDIPLAELAVLLSQTLVAMLHTNVLGTQFVGSRVDLTALWRFCLGAVTPPSARSRPAADPKR
jgi:AcrR family transcriptional regulator